MKATFEKIAPTSPTFLVMNVFRLFDYLPEEIWLWKTPRILHGVDVDALDVGPDLDRLVALVVRHPADRAVPVVEIYG